MKVNCINHVGQFTHYNQFYVNQFTDILIWRPYKGLEKKGYPAVTLKRDTEEAVYKKY